jgi:uncharacterized protein YbbC (DUF1343 family)
MARRKDRGAAMTAVRTGLDILVDEKMARLRGARVALLGNPAAVDRDFVHLLDRFVEHGVELVRLFGPEHGLLGDAQDMAHVGSDKDARTGLEVVSLYGGTYDSLFLRPEQLDGVDVLVCDLQDVGSRYYTFSYTIAFAMRACREAGVRCVVLDRPNPIGGKLVEGNLVNDAYRSFVGEYALPNRHGLTMGELCAAFQREDETARCELEVVWMDGWRRAMSMADSGAPWVMPSPNMPTPDTALVYPGGCLFEGTNLSEGRGTTRPFELVGAPYVDDPARLAARALEAGLEGVRLRPCWFRPTFQKHAGELCGGVQLHVTDPATFHSVRASVAIIEAARTFDGFDWRREEYEFVTDRLAIDLLFGDDRPRRALEGGGSVDDVMTLLAEDDSDVRALRDACRHAPYGDA